MQTVNFPPTAVSPVEAFGITVHAIRFGEKTIYSPCEPMPGRECLFFEDRFFASAENAALSVRLSALGHLGKNTRRRAWQALADELGVPYSRLMGVNSGGSSLREYY